MDPLCICFIKMDPSKNGKRNILVMTETFSKFSVAVLIPNQTAKPDTKALQYVAI